MSSTTPVLPTSSFMTSTSSSTLVSQTLSTLIPPTSQNSLLDISSQIENIINVDEIFDISVNDDNNSDLDYFLLKANSKKFLHRFVTENQKILNSKTITLHLPYNDPTEELYFWAKYATTEDLLKTPSISYLEERYVIN